MRHGDACNGIRCWDGVEEERDVWFAPIHRRSFGSFSKDIRACRSGSIEGDAVRLNQPVLEDGSCVCALAASTARQAEALIHRNGSTGARRPRGGPLVVEVFNQTPSVPR